MTKHLLTLLMTPWQRGWGAESQMPTPNFWLSKNYQKIVEKYSSKMLIYELKVTNLKSKKGKYKIFIIHGLACRENLQCLLKNYNFLSPLLFWPRTPVLTIQLTIPMHYGNLRLFHTGFHTFTAISLWLKFIRMLANIDALIIPPDWLQSIGVPNFGASNTPHNKSQKRAWWQHRHIFESLSFNNVFDNL